MGEQHLRLAQEQIAGIIERKMKARQNPALGFRIEVHQGVAAASRSRREMGASCNQVMAAENDRTPQVIAENWRLPDCSKYFFRHSGGTGSSCFSVYADWRAWVRASSSTSVA